MQPINYLPDFPAASWSMNALSAGTDSIISESSITIGSVATQTPVSSTYSNVTVTYNHKYYTILILFKNKTIIHSYLIYIRQNAKIIHLRFRTSQNALRIYVHNQCISRWILRFIKLHLLWRKSYIWVK